MKIREIAECFDSLYPIDRRLPWDNDGLQVSSDQEKEVHCVLTCLDVTCGAIEEAKRIGAELIVSHHPLLFSPLSSVTEDTLEGRKVLSLLESGISLISLHTRFDGAVNGLNEAFAKLLGIMPRRGETLLPEEPFIGGIGTLESPCSPEELARLVSRVLHTPVKLFSAGLTVQTVGYCTGAGKDLIPPCLRLGADAFIGGDISHHAALFAVEEEMTVIDCTHHASERFSAEIFRDELLRMDHTLQVIPFYEDLGGKIIDFT